MTQDQREINLKLRALEYAKDIGNVSKACRFMVCLGRYSINGNEPMIVSEKPG